jgi:hypothetical protein
VWEGLVSIGAEPMELAKADPKAVSERRHREWTVQEA